MKLKKLLSLFVCTLLVVSTLGVFNVSAETTPDKIINVPVGSAYTLPTEIDGAAVTWDKEVDTSNFGYKLYTGTTESGTVTYRVNVGEYKLVMSDDMSTHETTYTSETVGNNKNNGTFTGGSFATSKYDVSGGTSVTTTYSVRFESQDGNQVLAVGPEASQWAQIQYTLSSNVQAATKDDFKLSIRFKAEKYDLANSTSSDLYPLQMRVDNTAWMLWGRYNKSTEEGSSTYGKLGFSLYNTDETGKVAGSSTTYYAKNVASGIDENNVMSSDWCTVDIEAYNGMCNLRVDGKLLAENLYLPSVITSDGIAKFDMAKRTKADAANLTAFLDDVKISKLVYYEGNLSTATASVVQGADSKQTTNLTLTLNDGTTKDVIVAYTADTAEAGTKTAEGTIDGFDEKVEVTYTVLPVINLPAIDAVAGDTVTLKNGDTVLKDKDGNDITIPTEKIGILKGTVETADEIYNYTINVSGYVVKYYDDMEGHTNETWTDTKGTSATWQTIDPGTANGLKLEMSNNNTGNTSAIVTDNDGDQCVAIKSLSDGTAPKTSDKNTRWYIGENGVTGKFRISAKLKVDGFKQLSSDQRAFSFETYDASGNAVSHHISLQVSKNTSPNGKIQIRNLAETGSMDHTASADMITTTDLTNALHNVSYETSDDGASYGLDWFVLSVDFDLEGNRYTIYVNDVEIGTKNLASDNINNVKSIVFENRTGTSFAGNVYMDDLTVSVLDSFDGNMPASIDTVAAMGADGEVSSEIELSTVGGLKFYPTATYTVDTTKLGTSTVQATVEGFTDAIPVNVKVCNYNASYDAENITLTNISGVSGATAIVAYYGEGDVFIKADDLVAVNAAKDAAQAIPYNAPEGAVKVKVFIINNVTSVQPIDLLTEIPVA